jgi:hypothetical protein
MILMILTSLYHDEYCFMMVWTGRNIHFGTASDDQVQTALTDSHGLLNGCSYFVPLQDPPTCAYRISGLIRPPTARAEVWRFLVRVKMYDQVEVCVTFLS